MQYKFVPITIAALGLTAIVTQPAAAAAPLASGTVTTTALDTYVLTLNDSASSTTPIGSVWEAWVPGAFYMSTAPAPISILSPTGWTSNPVAGTGGVGHSIKWVASASSFDVPIGGSLSGLGFQSPDTNIESTSQVPGDTGIPTLTSVAYEAGLFSDGGATFVFTPTGVPEPTTLALLAPVAVLVLRRSRRSV